jgi:hypothetical protein
MQLIATLAKLLGIAQPCPHLSLDRLGRCEECGAWYPDWNPPNRGPVKRTSELSILALEETEVSTWTEQKR